MSFIPPTSFLRGYDYGNANAQWALNQGGMSPYWMDTGDPYMYGVGVPQSGPYADTRAGFAQPPSSPGGGSVGGGFYGGDVAGEIIDATMGRGQYDRTRPWENADLGSPYVSGETGDQMPSYNSPFGSRYLGKDDPLMMQGGDQVRFRRDVSPYMMYNHPYNPEMWDEIPTGTIPGMSYMPGEYANEQDSMRRRMARGDWERDFLSGARNNEALMDTYARMKGRQDSMHRRARGMWGR